MLKYILWDNDGVLVDTEYWYFKSTQRALNELGVELPKSTYLNYMSQGKSCWGMLIDTGVDLTTIESKRKERNVYYQQYLRTENIQIQGVIKVLQELSRTYKMGIVTTSRRADFSLIHNSSGIVQFMDFIICREDYSISKPDPEPYLCGLKKFAANTSEVVVVEDSQRGLQSAIAAKIDCVIVHNEFTKTHNFSGAKYRVKNLAQLPKLLSTL
jgi:HAD superfamily hydrolase (TIGR01509 family)